MGALLNYPRFRAFTAAGVPLAGGKVYTYIAGTSTPLATYSDGDLTTLNTNPVDLDANGEADIFGGTGEDYKVVLKNSVDVTQWTLDNISLGGSGSASPSSGVNFLDNGGFEGFSRTNTSATGASASFFCDRWCGYRGGQTGYTIAVGGTDGLPNRLVMQRDSGNSLETTLVVGQNLGYSSSGGIATTIQRALSPSVGGIPAQVLVFSGYIYKGANFSGAGVTLEIVSNPGDANICSGANWTVEASTTITAAELSTTSYVRASVSCTSLTNSGALGVRIKSGSISGPAGAADLIYGTGFKLELTPDGAPTAYVIPIYADSLLRCQRFYWFWGGSASSQHGLQGYNLSSAPSSVYIEFPIEMAKAPAASVAGTWAVTNCGQPTIASSASKKGCLISTVITANGAFAFYDNGTDDRINFDAET